MWGEKLAQALILYSHNTRTANKFITTQSAPVQRTNVHNVSFNVQDEG